MLKSFSIKKGADYFDIGGLDLCEYKLSVPNGSECSGLNIFVGKNGTGKTEFIKCIANISKGGSHFFVRDAERFLTFDFFATTNVVERPQLKSKKGLGGDPFEKQDPVPKGTYDNPKKLLQRFTTKMGNVEEYVDGFGLKPCNPDLLSSGEKRQAEFVYCMEEIEKDTIYVFDEPEKYLSPRVQRTIYSQILELSKNNQVIVATHSPYFIDWKNILDGATIFRFSLDYDLQKIYISSVSSSDLDGFGFCKNFQTCYKSGIESREFFFLDDCVFLVEGQDDVFSTILFLIKLKSHLIR